MLLPPFGLSSVGNNPDSISAVRRANVGCAQHSPPSIEPHLGQVSENSSKPPRSECWRVLHERVSRSCLTNDAGHFCPQPAALAIKSFSGSCKADVLAREAARNHVNKSAPRVSVKGANVIPNREGREKAIILSLGKNACGVGFPFNGAHGSPSEQLAAEYSSTSAGKEREFS